MEEDVAAAGQGQEVVARHAASLLVVRRDGASTSVLMARRHAAHRFMPGVLVFPGGAVDPADYGAAVAAPLRPEVRRRVERCAEPALAQALACAAARELAEEVGLNLGSPPRLDGLDYLCRAITPPDRATRFDAHFFVADESAVTGTLAGSAELEDPGWYTLEEAMEGKLAGATRAVLAQFRAWLDGHDREGPVPVLRERQWVRE